MLVANVAEIVLGRKQAFILSLVVIAFTGGYLAWREVNAKLHGCTFRAEAQCVRFERVETDEAQEKGLSGRDRLAATAGMLFAFKEPSSACFWMKDMHFNLDMIWLDSNWRVLSFEKNVSPGTYPKSFCPPEPASYVVELNSGAIDIANLVVGDQVKL